MVVAANGGGRKPRHVGDSGLAKRLGRKLAELTAAETPPAVVRWWDKSAELAARLGQELTACVSAPCGRGELAAAHLAKEARKGEELVVAKNKSDEQWSSSNDNLGWYFASGCFAR